MGKRVTLIGVPIGKAVVTTIIMHAQRFQIPYKRFLAKPTQDEIDEALAEGKMVIIDEG
jgi:hypothetical protein